MKDMQYIYGPVPSRRLGLSLGISPIPEKTCNYSCIYCQLGRTGHMTNTRQLFYPVADIVLPTLDACDEASFKRINRPHGSLEYEKVRHGLEAFSREYGGQLWIEIMLIKDVNDDDASLERYAESLLRHRYDRLYINTPVRPPAEEGVLAVDLLVSKGFHSGIKDDYEAILSIIKRHPMNQYEIRSFIEARGCSEGEALLQALKKDARVAVLHYKGYDTFRLR